MRKKGRRRWPFDVVSRGTVPAVFAMSKTALVEIGLRDRAAMNAIHTGTAEHAHLSLVMASLVVGLVVARASADDVEGIEAGTRAILGGVAAAYAAVQASAAGAGQMVDEIDRLLMERGLRVVEQLRDVAPRARWLVAYSRMTQDTAAFAAVLDGAAA